MRKFIDLKNKIYPLVFLFLILLLWQISLKNGWIETYLLPYPYDVLKTLFLNRHEISSHLWVTLQESILGLIMATIFAVIVTFFMDRFVFIKKALFPILLISQMIPVIILAPLLSLWFGLTMTPKIIVVVLICFFPIVISLVQGFSAIDQDKINLLKSMGATKIQVFRILKLPSALISFFSGLKVAATYSFMGAVISEWMGGAKGIGIYYLRSKKSFDINRVFAAVLVIIIMSILIYSAVAQIQKITTKFQKL